MDPAPRTASMPRASSSRSSDSVPPVFLSDPYANASRDFFADPLPSAVPLRSMVPPGTSEALWHTPRREVTPATLQIENGFEEEFEETAPSHDAPMGRSPRIDTSMPRDSTETEATWLVNATRATEGGTAEGERGAGGCVRYAANSRTPLVPVGVNVSHRGDPTESRGAVRFSRGERSTCAELPQWRRERSTRAQPNETATTTTSSSSSKATVAAAAAAAVGKGTGTTASAIAVPREGQRWVLTRNSRHEEDAVPLSALLEHSWAAACNEDVVYWRRRCAVAERQLALHRHRKSEKNGSANTTRSGGKEEVHSNGTQQPSRVDAATSTREDHPYDDGEDHAVLHSSNEQERTREKESDSEREREREREREEWREEADRLRADRNAFREEFHAQLDRCEQLETDLLAREEQEVLQREQWAAHEAELSSRQEKLAAMLRQEHVKVASTSEEIERVTAELRDARDRESYLRKDIARLEEKLAKGRDQSAQHSPGHESAALHSLVHALEAFLRESAGRTLCDLPSPVRGTRAGESDAEDENGEERSAEKSQQSLVWRAADGLRRLTTWANELRVRHAALREELEVVRADRNGLLGQQNKEMPKLQHRLLFAETDNKAIAAHAGFAEALRETDLAEEVPPVQRLAEARRQLPAELDKEKECEKERESRNGVEKAKEKDLDAEFTVTRRLMNDTLKESPAPSTAHTFHENIPDVSASRPRRRVTFAETIVAPSAQILSRAFSTTPRSLSSSYTSNSPTDPSPSPQAQEFQKQSQSHVGRGAMRWHQEMWKQQEEVMGIDIEKDGEGQ